LQDHGRDGSGRVVLPISSFLPDDGLVMAERAQMQTANTNDLRTPGSCEDSPSFVEQHSYCVAGITFGLRAKRGLRLGLDKELEAFAHEAEACDVNIEVSWADSLAVPQTTPLFYSGGLWSLFAEPSGYRFSFLSELLGKTPYKEAWFDPEFRAGRVLLSRRYFDTEQPVYPLEYPLDELLMIHRLSRGEGVEVHAVGISDDTGRGRLFLGHSGAGKSTTARLWLNRLGVKILSDDRIILRACDGRIFMYGTPWHGDAGIASPDCAPLSDIYLLEHGQRNECVSVPQGRIAAELFARSFVTHHSEKGIRFTLDFLDRVAREIPCSIFRFVPDETAVEAICRAGA
jgi:hypothetical protein